MRTSEVPAFNDADFDEAGRRQQYENAHAVNERNYSKELLEPLMRLAYMLKDDDGVCDLTELVNQLHERGVMLKFADEDVSQHALLTSPDMERYFSIHDDGGRAVLQLTPDGEQMALRCNNARYSNPQTLFTWAFMGKFEERLTSLADLALPEPWGEGEHRHGVLSAYITNTFKRLLHERREGNRYAIIETDKWAAFNTGLVDKMYDQIYALFSLNKKENMQRWTFHSWCTPGNKRSGQILSRHFQILPRKASYFTQPSELLYDENEGVPTLPFDHIVERIERLPLSFLSQFAPAGFDWPSDEDFKPDRLFYDSFRAALCNDDYTRLRLKDALELSLRRAVKKVAWNYRMAIPVYDAKRRKLMLLIPMSLDFRDNDHIDIALMVERAKVSRKYVGHTILTLGMAYRKARMILRPEADWLSPALLEDMASAHETVTDDEELQLAQEITDADADAVKAKADAMRKAEDEIDAGQDGAGSDPFLYQHENDAIYRPEGGMNRVKILDKIDVSGYNKDHLYRPGTTPAEDNVRAMAPEEAAHTPRPRIAPAETDYRFPPSREFDVRGVYHEGYGKPYILVGRYRYEAREFTDDNLIDEDDVIFDIEKEENKWKSSGMFHYAVNIRLADD